MMDCGSVQCSHVESVKSSGMNIEFAASPSPLFAVVHMLP